MPAPYRYTAAAAAADASAAADAVREVKRALGLDAQERRQRLVGGALAAVGTCGGVAVWVWFG